MQFIVYCALPFEVVKRCFKYNFYLTLSYTGFFRLVLHGRGGGVHKVPAAFFSETVKANAIKLGTLTN